MGDEATREPALTALLRLRRRLAEGGGGVLVIEGGAGAGKSRLLRSALADAEVWRRVSARRQEATLPYAALHALLAGCGEGWGHQLTRALSGQPADRFGVGLELLDLVTQAAARAPRLLVVDDAQWLDGASADALGFVASRLATRPVAVVIAQRRAGPDWDLPTVRLRALEPAAGAALLHRIAPDLPGDVGHALLTLAAGNPGALVDLVAALTPEQRRGDAEPPAALPVTSRLHQDYVDQLRALPRPAQRLLRALAAEPGLSTGEAIRVAAALGQEVAAFEPAERAGVVRFDQDTVDFGEPLRPAAIYRSMTLLQRQQTHGDLARALADDPVRHVLHRVALRAGPDAALADRLERAAVAAEINRSVAARALVRAAELSVDPSLAATRFIAAARIVWSQGDPRRARALLRRVPNHALDPPVRVQGELLRGEIELRAGASGRAGQALLAAAGELTDDREQRVAAMLRAGEALCLAGEYPDFATVAQEALALRRPGDPTSTQLVYEQFAGLTAMFRGDHARGIPALRRVIELATSLDESGALLRASTAAIVLGDDHRARLLATRAAALARAAGDRATEPLALELAAAAECALGQYAAASTTLDQALPLARASGQESLCSTLLGLMAVLAATVGDRATCAARIAEARAHGVSRSEALVEWALGLLDLVEGRPVEAAARLLALMGMDLGQGQLVIRVAATPHLVEAGLRAGERAAVEPAFAAFEVWTTATGNPAWLALAERCQALMADDADVAEKHFVVALEHHQAAQAEFERARTQLLFGQHLRRSRRPGAAREHLRMAADTFRRFHADGLADQAGAELRAAGEHGGRADGLALGVLTAQQMQIVRLAAEGATNREVAAALVLSTRTVDYHMRNILSRLGLRSRVELVRLVK